MSRGHVMRYLRFGVSSLESLPFLCNLEKLMDDESVEYRERNDGSDSENNLTGHQIHLEDDILCNLEVLI